MNITKLIWTRKRRREKISKKVMRLALNIIRVTFILSLLAAIIMQLQQTVSTAIDNRTAQAALATRQQLPTSIATSDISKIEISTRYNAAGCGPDRPISVSVVNTTDRAILRLELQITATLENSNVNFWRHLYTGPDGVSVSNQHIFFSEDYLKITEYERVIVENVHDTTFLPGTTKSWCIAPELWSLPNYNIEASSFRYTATIVETGLKLSKRD